jgi:hypothetical protein
MVFETMVQNSTLQLNAPRTSADFFIFSKEYLFPGSQSHDSQTPGNIFPGWNFLFQNVLPGSSLAAFLLPLA